MNLLEITKEVYIDPKKVDAVIWDKNTKQTVIYITGSYYKIDLPINKILELIEHNG